MDTRPEGTFGPSEQAEARARDCFDKLLRLKAEFENFRKRTEKERDDYRAQGKREILRQVMGLLDIIDEAKRYTRRASDASVNYGLDLLTSGFRKFLQREGLDEIAPRLGEPFDPALHDAVEADEQAGQEGRIIMLFQKGYLLDGKLLRPARVRVSRNRS